MVDFIRRQAKLIQLSFIRKKINLSSNYQIPVYKSILILAPHPDDEILGLGGVIIQAIHLDTIVHLVYLTDGEGSGAGSDKEEIRSHRIALSEQVCERLGVDPLSITRLHLTDGLVPYPGQEGFEETVKTITQLIDLVKPEAFFATHLLDYWPYDHVACAHIAHKAISESIFKPQLWYYWVWAWYNIKPFQLFKLRIKQVYRINIQEQNNRKRELIAIYFNDSTPAGKPWSGVLPDALLKALNFPVEIVERIS